MGCMSSKPARCPHCRNRPYSPATVRSFSMPVHHLPEKLGDSYHVVALTSSTLGSLELDHIDAEDKSQKGASGGVDVREKASEEAMELMWEGKAWSDMIEEKIPKFIARHTEKTPLPPGEPETINVSELMAGLDDSSPVRLQRHFRSFTFDVVRSPVADHATVKMPEIEEARRRSVDLVVQENEKKSLDPESISALRKSFEELSPDNPFHLTPEAPVKSASAFSTVSSDHKYLSFGKDKVIMYSTSLRGVRKTYEDCLHVRLILTGLGLRVDERDMSMHSGFKDELKEVMGDAFRGAALPRVFIGRKYVGGTDDIRRLNEEGQLEKVFQGCERIDGGGRKCGITGADTNKACDACGDVRFVPCETCSGSCKIFYGRDDCSDDDFNEEDSDRTHEDCGGFGFRRCPDCNENGLIRCPVCCY